MHTDQIFDHLKKHGQLLDTEIAKATGIPLAKVHKTLSDLLKQQKISQCEVTHFKNGKPVEGFLCRISGYYPPAVPGRKPGVSV